MNIADSFDGINSGVVDTTTAKLDLVGAVTLYLFAKKATGTIASLVLTLQCSPDGTEWTNTTHTLTFADEANQPKDNVVISARYVRWKVTTKSAIASTVDIQINAK